MAPATRGNALTRVCMSVHARKRVGAPRKLAQGLDFGHSARTPTRYIPGRYLGFFSAKWSKYPARTVPEAVRGPGKIRVLSRKRTRHGLDKGATKRLRARCGRQRRRN